MRRRALVVVAVVLLAGCPAPGGSGTAGDADETVTPVPVPTTERPSPPGVTGERVAVGVLTDAHARRLVATNYTLVVRQRIVRDGETVSVFEHVRRVAVGGETYAGRYGWTLENPVVPMSTRSVAYWTGGDGYASRHRGGGRTIYLGWTRVGDPIRDVDRSRHLNRTLRVVDVRATGRVGGGVVLTGERSGPVPAISTPQSVADPRNATVTARVRVDGLVTNWRYGYDARLNGEPVRVTYRGAVTAVGSTTVGRPAWADRARNRSAR